MHHYMLDIFCMRHFPLFYRVLLLPIDPAFVTHCLLKRDAAKFAHTLIIFTVTHSSIDIGSFIFVFVLISYY